MASAPTVASAAAPADGLDPGLTLVDIATAGEGGWPRYRIPALTVAPNGDLLAFYDGRPAMPDLPSNIALLMRRSTDGGRTWREPQVIRSAPAPAGFGDPSALVDRVTGDVFVFHAASVAAGFASSTTGSDPVDPNVLHADYSVSHDNGVTWTHRRITAELKTGRTDWAGMFAASGEGIQLRRGPHAGRLIQQYTVRRHGENYAVSAWSDDHGASWHTSAPVGPGADENKTVELSDGRIMLNARATPFRLVAVSSDGGATWSPLVPDSALPDPGNNGSIIRAFPEAVPGDSRARMLLFSNTANPAVRRNLTVRLSCDDGATWPVSRVVQSGASAYSTLTPLRGADGRLGGRYGLLYERDEYRHISFTSFGLDWLGGGCDGVLPQDAWLLMANPAEDMASGITIGWHARVPGTFLEIAPDPDSAFAAPRRVPGVCEPVTHLDTATEISHEVLKCRADVGGLEGGRAYRYRAGRGSFSRPGRFLTAARARPFSFLYLSDVHVHNPLPGRLEAAVALLERARTLEPDVRFTILGGDMLAYGSAYGAWNSMAASPLVSTQLTAFTPGNHDFYDHEANSRGPGYFNTFVHNPANGAEGVANTSYFFRYGNALFVSISSEDSWSSNALLEAQQAWFRRVVTENPATFIIAWTHRPFYNGSTGNAGHALTNRTNWSPLFDELGVDLVLSGHDHVYVRTAPTFGGTATRVPGKGTVYLNSTAVGDRYMDADPENPYPNLERILGGGTLGTIFTLEPDAIRLRTLDLSGTIVDEAVLPARRREAAPYR